MRRREAKSVTAFSGFFHFAFQPGFGVSPVGLGGGRVGLGAFSNPALEKSIPVSSSSGTIIPNATRGRNTAMANAPANAAHNPGRDAIQAATDRHLLDRFLTHNDEAAFAALVQRHSRT